MEKVKVTKDIAEDYIDKVFGWSKENYRMFENEKNDGQKTYSVFHVGKKTKETIMLPRELKKFDGKYEYEITGYLKYNHWVSQKGVNIYDLGARKPQWYGDPLYPEELKPEEKDYIKVSEFDKKIELLNNIKKDLNEYFYNADYEHIFLQPAFNLTAKYSPYNIKSVNFSYSEESGYNQRVWWYNNEDYNYDTFKKKIEKTIEIMKAEYENKKEYLEIIKDIEKKDRKQISPANFKSIKYDIDGLSVEIDNKICLEYEDKQYEIDMNKENLENFKKFKKILDEEYQEFVNYKNNIYNKYSLNDNAYLEERCYEDNWQLLYQGEKNGWNDTQINKTKNKLYKYFQDTKQDKYFTEFKIQSSYVLALDSNFNVVGKTGDIIEPENVALYDLQNGDYLDKNHIFNLSEEEIKEKLQDIKKEYDPENKIPPFKANVTFSKGIGGSDGYRPKGDHITWTEYIVTNKFRQFPVIGRAENDDLRKDINDFVDELYSKTNKDLVLYILSGGWPSKLEEALEKYMSDKTSEKEQDYNRDIR